MRIALIDGGWTVGGTLTMTANISRGLPQQGGHKVSAVVTSSRSPNASAIPTPPPDWIQVLASERSPGKYQAGRAP